MKSLMLLWEALLNDLGVLCRASTRLDLKKAKFRFEHEGVSYLTLTLPAFGKELEKALELGQVVPSAFAGFQRRGGLPLFLGGFLERVFDRKTGLLLQEPDVDSIFAIRQLTLAFSKVLIDCSKERKKGAIDAFLQCEQDVRSADKSTSLESVQDLQRVSALLLRDVFTLMDSDVYYGNITGKHGPGATADRLLGNRKYDLSEWPARLESEFPYGDFGVANPRYNYMYDHVDILEPGKERPVKVTLVPKTLKTPRVIAIEPSAVQYMQQGIMEKLVEYLERDKTLRGMIGFSDQEPNRLMAEKGSRDGLLATLDLSEASDRVSNQHVRAMLHRWPSFLRAVDATRSRKAVMPDKRVIRLAKFASMGSALCFPVEAMVFLSVVFLGIERELNHRLTRGDVRFFSGMVRVYGDDIIVPVRYAHSVMQTLETFGFRVNAHKSFWNGKFRESCGKEYYDGHDVSVTRVRRVLPTSRSDVQEIISTVALRNQLYSAGLWGAAKHLDEVLCPIIRHYPLLSLDANSIALTGKPGPGSPLLGRQSVLDYVPEWADASLHTPLVKGWEVRSKPPVSLISGEGALLKCFLKRGDLPIADRRHLERQGRPKRVDIQLRYRTPF